MSRHKGQRGVYPGEAHIGCACRRIGSAAGRAAGWALRRGAGGTWRAGGVPAGEPLREGPAGMSTSGACTGELPVTGARSVPLRRRAPVPGRTRRMTGPPARDRRRSTPAQLASAYGYEPNAGHRQTVGVVDAYDDPNIEKDLGEFDKNYGLPECTSETAA